LRVNADLVAERDRVAPSLEAEPDKTLSFVAEMNMPSVEGETGIFACPMHPEIVASWEGKCPKCGMKLMPAGPEVAAPTEYACPMHPAIAASWEGKCPKCGMKLMPAGPEVAAPTEYACPMHPEITATWAGECPKCG